MTAWKYIKGSESDFEGAPNEALILTIDNFRRKHFGEVFPASGEKYWSDLGGKGEWGIGVHQLTFNIIAQRERVTSINDDRLAKDMSLPRERIHKPDANPVDPAIRYIRVDGAMFPDTNGEWVKTDTSTYEKIKPLVTDVVNHPKHYTRGGIECIDAIKAATVGKSGIEAVCVANVVKYLWRYEEKNGVEDVKKAHWYLERLIQEMGE